MNIKTAAIFSGQGAQYLGMGVELLGSEPAAKRVYEAAGDILGYDVAALTEEQLACTLYAQPAIYALSVAAFEAARADLGEIHAVAGHSLGEFAALCCAGSYSVEDGFRIIKARAEAMEEAAQTCPGAMCAIIGSDEDTVVRVCEETDGFVEPVNFNLPSQTVVSGEEAAVTAASESLALLGARRTVRLNVSSAFHTKIMEPAAKRFHAEIEDIPFRAPAMAFYSNVTGGKLLPEDFPAYFAEHMVSPVRFTGQVTAMASDGVAFFVEFGPGKSVSALVKKNNRALEVCHVEDTETLAELRARAKKSGASK